jgi:hypothetical protein
MLSAYLDRHLDIKLVSYKVALIFLYLDSFEAPQ